MLGIAPSNPSAPPADPTRAIEFFQDGVTDTVDVENVGGIIGARSEPIDRAQEQRSSVTGSFVIEPKPSDLSALLPYVMGKAATGSTAAEVFTLGNCFSSLDYYAMRGIAPCATTGPLFVYRENVVASAQFTAGEGERLRATFNLMGKFRDMTINPAYTWPTITTDRAQPFRFVEAVLTIGATTYAFKRFSINVDNMLSPRYINSLTPTEFPTTGRSVTVSLGMPWGSSLALHQGLRTSLVNTLKIKLEYGSGATLRNVMFELPSLYAPANRSPVVSGRDEIPWDVDLKAGHTSAFDNELKITVKSA